MTAKRFAAFLAAVVLIVGAVLLRNALDDKSSSATDPSGTPQSGKVTVICSTEFASICSNLGKNYTVTTEAAATTLDRLAKDGAPRPDAWITLDPFPGMLDTTRTFANLSPATTGIVAVATDEPALAVPKARSAAITAGCSGQSAWKCVGAAAGQKWTDLSGDAGAGRVIPGIEDPYAQAIGLVTFANAVSGYFGTTDLDPGSWSDVNFGKWMRNFSSGVKVVVTGTSPLSRMLVRPTEVNVAATTATEIATKSQSEFATIAVSPAMKVIAVVAMFSSRASALPATLAPLLVDAGWTAASDTKPQLPAGTFIALRKFWKDNT